MRAVSFTMIAILLSVVVLLFGWLGCKSFFSAGDAPALGSSPTGSGPSPIDDAEILAAIRAMCDTDSSARSDEAQRMLIKLSEGQPLPANAVRHEVGTIADHGGRYVYDVLDTILLIPIGGGEELRISIRKRYVGSRTLEAEIARLDGVLATTPAMPGRYRLEDRVKELKFRVKSVQKK